MNQQVKVHLMGNTHVVLPKCHALSVQTPNAVNEVMNPACDL